ncbi:HAD family hydrolase [Paenibacillus sp. GCM10012307]|uniref:HAD family hydrolase n=1 Tax=Paenibacillus roseus TaxID=2798579 RepID=A0A934J3X4_9BACL|nr:HAD family hydrolase [Paenibacillus roseus]MBJ6362819.1 HAD family hydrolase [Paenibacillus roseus]
MSETKLLLFDLDDTLLHFEDYWTKSMYESFDTFPLTRDIGMDQLFPVFLKHDEQFHENWLDGTIDAREFRNLRYIHTLADFNINVGVVESMAFEQWFRTIRAAYIPRDTMLVEQLANWAKRYKIGILTNGTAEDQYDKLWRMGLDQLFAEGNVFVSDEIGFAKPNKEAYLHAASAMNCLPEETVFIGDSWVNDVAGPLEAGMKAIWLNKKRREQPGSPVPTGIIDQLQELEIYI